MNTQVKPGNHDDQQYETFLARFDARFAANVANGTRPLFTTDATDLFKAYLESYPEGDARQHRNCSACRHFIEHFGGLVTINELGLTSPALWNEADAGALEYGAVAELARIVRKAKVTGVFLSSQRTWGQPVTGVWRHMAVTLPSALVHSGIKNAGQAMAEKREDYNNVSRALAEYSKAMLGQALTLLETNSLYRAERVIGPAKWLQQLHVARETAHSKENVVWRAIATAPAGFCHPRSSMVGTLLDDIASGMRFEDVATRFASKMAPSTYQRAQAAPAAGAIAQAEKLFEQAGLAPALPRRYARLAEIQSLWKPRAEKTEAAAASSVFGHLTPKGETAEVADLSMPAITMTWDKFRRVVLPVADSIEVVMPENSDRLVALVTAVNQDAPPILQWDRPEERNPVSWYYASGIDAEVKRRVTRAGGQYENVDIRASLLWNNRNDLDLHVLTPGNEHIFFRNKQARCGGWLDVDMNVRGETTTPIENTRWSRGHARPGQYVVYVANWAFHEHRLTPTPFRIELEVNGDVFHLDGSVYNLTGIEPAAAGASFVYSRDRKVSVGQLGHGWRAAGVSHDEWGVAGAGRFAKLSAITESPNLWGANPQPHNGRHIFFLVEGCKDPQEGVGRGFFTETLRSELHGVRSVLEAYSSSATIAGADTADACGIGMSDQVPWNLTLRVTSGGRRVVYTLDRID